MDEVIYSSHQAGLMLIVLPPKRGRRADEYRIHIGDYSDLDSFVPRDAFTFFEIPIVTRLLNAAYPVVFQHYRENA